MVVFFRETENLMAKLEMLAPRSKRGEASKITPASEVCHPRGGAPLARWRQRRTRVAGAMLREHT